MTSALAQQCNLPLTRGEVVTQVASCGPADKAGPASPDVITGLDNVTIHTDADLTAVLATLAPGATVPITFIDSSGDLQRVSVTLGYPNSTSAATYVLML
jgi:putative serine protease PepD